MVLRHPFFIISSLLFVINFLFEKISHRSIPWVHAYMDDLLCMPVVLGLTLHIFRKIHPGKEKYRFEWHHVLVAVVYYSLIFEWLLPNRSSVYTRDIWDIFFYALGGVLFYFTMNKEGR
jgi:hypothetical protein